MENLVRKFDAPPDSAEHAELRETVWLGGAEIEGRYLLGMILGENLFRLSYEDSAQRLKDFIAARCSPRASEILCTLRYDQTLVPFLKRVYERETNYPPYTHDRNKRTELAMEYLLQHLDATPAELASAANTKEKQILRMPRVMLALRAVQSYEGR